MMHGSYRRKFGPESVVELSKNITVQHDDYLKQDDPDKKADALRYMAGYVTQYLHLVPHDKKFTFKETERVLHNSAMKIAEFDPREASIAFTDLAKYAENLLEQPWRKEFHVIKLTSGFYYHNIEAQLQNAHEILIVLGYVNIDEYTLKLVPGNMSFPILKAVSRDCYVASQECLVLSQIWQHTADQEPDYPLTIGEVFEYRKNHLGDTETICNKLLYDIRARLHTVKQQQLSQIPPHHQYQPQPPQPYHPQVPAHHHQQRFVPVEKLIDYEDTSLPKPLSRDSPDHAATYHRYAPEREVAKTTELMKNLNVYDDSHIYDPVYDPVPKYTGASRKSAPAPQYPNNNGLNNNNIRKSNVYGYDYQPYQQQQQHLLRDSVSPLIPKTVTNCFHNNVSKSNSMSSIHNNRAPQALTRSKVTETEVDVDPTSPREHQPYPLANNIQRPRKSLPAITQQVYPDQFYPQIVRPTPVYGQTTQYYGVAQQPQPPQQLHHLPYPSETPYQHQSTPIPSDSEVNIHRASSSGSSSYTSVREADPSSSRVRRSEPMKRPTHIDLQQRSVIPHMDSSPDPHANLSSSESAGSPRYPNSANRELNSLDTVYYDYLLKQGQTNEFLPDLKNVNVSSQPESNHLYDGRRVVPKTHNADANEQSYNLLSSSSEQQQKRIPEKHVRVPSESTYPQQSYTQDQVETPEEELPQPEKITPWDCRFCTFRNEREARICEVCAKSNDFFEEEQNIPQPQQSTHTVTPKMYSVPSDPRAVDGARSAEQDEGERPCPQCTLLNSPRARICDACNYRLKPIESPRNVETFDNR